MVQNIHQAISRQVRAYFTDAYASTAHKELVHHAYIYIYASVNRVSIGSDNGLFGAKPLSKPRLGYCQLDP